MRGAPLGGGDPTRSWAVGLPGGEARFPGLTRAEAAAAAPALAGRDPGRCLVAVALPVLLTGGAGPHLVDHCGGLVLALGPHPRIPGARVAMGPCAAGVQVGLVRQAAPGAGLWEWAVRAEVADADRVSALDALDAVGDPAGAEAWRHDPTGAGPSRSLPDDTHGGGG